MFATVLTIMPKYWYYYKFICHMHKYTWNNVQWNYFCTCSKYLIVREQCSLCIYMYIHTFTCTHPHITKYIHTCAQAFGRHKLYLFRIPAVCSKHKVAPWLQAVPGDKPAAFLKTDIRLSLSGGMRGCQEKAELSISLNTMFTAHHGMCSIPAFTDACQHHAPWSLWGFEWR